MKISEVIRILKEVNAEYGDLDFVTVQEIGEMFGIGTHVQIGIIDYPLDEQEQNWEKVVGVTTDVNINQKKPGLTLIK